MSAVLRLKRKACTEPAEGLVVALKRPKSNEFSDKNEVYFKFAATLKTESDSIKDQIQAVLSKDKNAAFSKWRDLKSTAVKQRNVKQICEKLKKENKAVSEKKKLDLLNNRRLIFSETLPIEEEESSISPNAEVRKLFQLYDIIEENEEVKKQVEDMESTITCNNELLIREKTGDYVYDVYISDVQIDESFVKNTISVRPCTITEEDIYSGDSDNSVECYEDEDDSNDENNWRNEYPEDEDSRSEQDSDEYDECRVIKHSFNDFHIDKDDDRSSQEGDSFDESRVLRELNEDTD